MSARTNAAVRSVPAKSLSSPVITSTLRGRDGNVSNADASPSMTLRNPAFSSAVERVDLRRAARWSRSTCCVVDRSGRRAVGRRGRASCVDGRGRRRRLGEPLREQVERGVAHRRSRRRSGRARTASSCTLRVGLEPPRVVEPTAPRARRRPRRAARLSVCLITSPSTPRSATIATDCCVEPAVADERRRVVDVLLELLVLLRRAPCSALLRSLVLLARRC